MIICAFLLAALPFSVVENARPSCALVATGNAAVDGDIAAFTNAVYRMSGASLPVVGSETEAGDGSNRIVFTVEKRSLFDEDDWRMSFTSPATLRVAGSWRSCRWALNRLLDDWGVVPCHPGPHGTYYPPRRTLRIERRDRSGTASLKLSRDLYIEDREWLRALGCKSYGDTSFFNHSMHAVLPTAKYGVEPWLSQIMPERNGKRVKPANHYSSWQPCWASGTGRREAVKNICDFLRRHPEQKVFSLSVNDLEGYCTCAACKELNGGSFDRPNRFSRHKNHSESYYRWVNAVAEGVQKEFPDIVFGVLAYCGTTDPPSFKLNPRVVPFLCCETYQMQDKKVAAEREELFAAWSEKAEAFGLWDYAYGCRAYQAPRMYLKTMTEYFALKKKYPKLQAFFMEGDTFVGEGPKRYLYGKLISDPDCDAEAELARWYEACCGKAAAADLRAYYEIWEKFYNEGDIKKTLWYTRGLRGVYMDFESKRYIFALPESELERATQLAARVVAAANESGDADQKIRAARFDRWHRLYTARLVSGGVGLTDYEGNFTDATSAARFFRRMPEMSDAFKKVGELSKEIAADRRSEGGDSRERLYGHCDGLVRNAKMNPNFASLFNAALLHLDDPAVRRAMKAVCDDERVEERYRRAMKGLLVEAELPNEFYPKGLSVEEDLKLWSVNKDRVAAVDRGFADNGSKATGLVNRDGGWPAAVRGIPEVDPESDYLFRARLTNESKVPVTVRMLYSNSYPKTYEGYGSGFGIERLQVVKPGEKVNVSLFCMTRPIKGYKYPAGRIYVILNGLPQNETVVIDSCKFTPLESKR